MQLSAISLAITRLWSGSSAWTPAALWPTGTEPGMWIDPSNLATSWQDYTGTTPVSPPGSVADSSNPVGLALDLRLGASVLTDPGNHLFQATSTARPLLSGRVNAFQYTQNLTGAFWTNFTSAPLGVNYIKEAAIYAGFGFGSPARRLVGVQNVTATARVKAGLRTKVAFVVCSASNVTGSIFIVDIPAKTAVIDNRGSSVGTFFAEDSSDGYLYISCSTTNISATDGVDFQCIAVADNLTYYYGYTGLDDAIAVYVTDLDLRPTGQADLPYQAILADGSTYPATGFPIYQKYDGTDDGMATASFPAGTLSNAMDCMIAVRLESDSPMIVGLLSGPHSNYFGHVESGLGLQCFIGVGTPTFYVDGIQLTGGPPVTAGMLYTALSGGSWHIFEVRGLDLSAWETVVYGTRGASYSLNGGQGGILLFPSSTSAADRDAARTWLGAKVGLTL